MKKVILNYARCKNSGELGLIMEGVIHDSVYAARDGRLVAHDVIEHNGSDTVGGIAHELEALGITWWIRGSLNDLNRYMQSMYSPYDALANDLIFMAESLIAESSELGIPVPNNRYSDYDDDFKDIIKIARQKVFRSINRGYYDSDSIDHDALQRYFDNCINFMRSGYQKARRRYRRLTQNNINTLFWDIAFAIDNIFEYLDYEGQQVELKYCLTSSNVKCRILYPEHD